MLLALILCPNVTCLPPISAKIVVMNNLILIHTMSFTIPKLESKAGLPPNYKSHGVAKRGVQLVQLVQVIHHCHPRFCQNDR